MAIQHVKNGFSLANRSMELVLPLFVFNLAWNLANLFFVVPRTPGTQTPPSPLSIVLGLVFVLMSLYIQAGALAYVREKTKGAPASLQTFLAGGGRYFVPILLLALVVGAVGGVIILVSGLAMAALQVIGIVIMLLLAAGGIYLAVLVFLAPYAIVADDLSVGAGIKRSVAFVRANMSSVLLLGGVLLAIGFFIGIFMAGILSLLGAMVPNAQRLAQILFAVVSSYVNAYMGLAVGGAFMELYLANSRGATA